MTIVLKKNVTYTTRKKKKKMTKLEDIQDEKKETQMNTLRVVR